MAHFKNLICPSLSLSIRLSNYRLDLSWLRNHSEHINKSLLFFTPSCWCWLGKQWCWCDWHPSRIQGEIVEKFDVVGVYCSSWWLTWLTVTWARAVRKCSLHQVQHTGRRQVIKCSRQTCPMAIAHPQNLSVLNQHWLRQPEAHLCPPARA